MSEWWCKDKTSPYDIRPEDGPLISAAIKLGELLQTYEEATQEQKDAIAAILTFLRNLPAQAPVGLHGDFGFDFVADDETWDHGIHGSWFVSLYRGGFEIGCVPLEGLPEFAWELCPGWKNLNRMDTAGEWITQVLDPRSLLLPGKRFRIQAKTISVSDE